MRVGPWIGRDWVAGRGNKLAEVRHIGRGFRGWRLGWSFAGRYFGLEEAPFSGLLTARGADRVVEVGEFLQHPGENASDEVGNPVRRLRVDLFCHPLHCLSDRGLDGLYCIEEEGERIPVVNTARRPAVW